MQRKKKQKKSNYIGRTTGLHIMYKDMIKIKQNQYVGNVSAIYCSGGLMNGSVQGSEPYHIREQKSNIKVRLSNI